MPISGKFVADFASFYDAVQKAETSLRSFETGAGKVETSLNRMVDAFSGRKVISDAQLMVEAVDRVGGTSKLTEKELARVSSTAAEAAAKMKAMGIDVPPGLQKIADETRNVDKSSGGLIGTVKDLALSYVGLSTVRGIAGYAQGLVTEASALRDLSQQTHINVEEIQLLAGAMSEFGVDADTLGRGLYKLSRGIAGGDDSVARGLHMMGMGMEEVQGLNGEQLFLKIMHGLSTLQGGLRDTASAELFGGKLGAAMAGASEGIDGALEKWKRLNHALSTEAVEAMDQYDESIKAATKSLNALAGEVIGRSAQTFNVLTEAVDKGAGKWKTLWALYMDVASQVMMLGTGTEHLASLIDQQNQTNEKNAAVSRSVAAAHREVAAAIDSRTQAEKFMAALEADAAKALTTTQLQNLAHLKEIGALNAQNAAAIGVNAAQFAKYEAEATKAAEAEKKMKEAMEELNSAGVGWEGTLATINGEVLTAIRGYLDAGVSQAALATAYGLTATQIKSVTTFMADQKKQQELNDAAIQQTTELWNEYDELRVKQGGTVTDIQIAQTERWAADLTARMKKAQLDTTEFYDALAATSKAKIQSVLLDWDAIGRESKSNLQQAADKAEATFNYMLGHADQFSIETINKFWKIATDARQAADAWGLSFTNTLDEIDRKNTQVTSNVMRTWSEAMDAVRQGQGTMTGTMQVGAGVFKGSSRADVEMAFQAGRYWGPVLPNGTPDFARLGLARGGPVIAGRPYLVGERGPELFVPRSAGTVLPSGAGHTFNVSIGSFYGSDPTSVQRLARTVGDELLDQAKLSRKF